MMGVVKSRKWRYTFYLLIFMKLYSMYNELERLLLLHKDLLKVVPKASICYYYRTSMYDSCR